MTQTIRYISHDDIDKSKWDQCIEESSNGIVFAYSWYLDAVFTKWDALVLGEYETVFPITKKTKFGLNYFFNPIFALQLGVFSKGNITKQLLEQFIQLIPKKVKLIDIDLNFGNFLEDQSFDISIRKCQFLDLSSSYEDLAKNYSKNLKRSLTKARKHNLRIVKSEDTESVIQLFRENRGGTLKEIEAEHYERLQNLINQLNQRGKSVIYECWFEEELLASACFSITNKRIIYIKGGSNSKGRELCAMHFIMNEVILMNSNSELTFDFGGSSIEQVARFNHGFGAKDYEYQHIYRNNLPFFIKLLKK